MSANPSGSRAISPVPRGMSEAEWGVRCDLAACYQLIDLYGMSELAATHISARVPGPHDHFLLNPLGTLFDQITASSLVKVDVNGKVLDGNDPALVNAAGFVIHSAIHMARPDLTCAVHTHTPANNAVACLKQGLLPLTLKASVMMGFVGYHDCEGPSLHLDERERIVRDLGESGRVIIMRNHGAMTVGQNVAEAFVWMHRLETACRYQVAALSQQGPGVEINWTSEELQKKSAQIGLKYLASTGQMKVGLLEWSSLLVKLERERGTSYRT